MATVPPTALPGFATLVGMFTQAGPWAVLAAFLIYQLVSQGQYYDRQAQEQHIRMAETQVLIVQQQSDIVKTLERINTKLDTR